MKLEALKLIPPWEWPDSAAETLLGVLRDEHASDDDLLTAAELAGDPVVIDDELADALLLLVRDQKRSDELRGTAAIALGPVLEQADLEGFEDIEGFEDLGGVPISEKTYDRIRVTLTKLYRDGDVPELVRRRVLEASVRAPADWHTAAIRAAYASSAVEWRVTAVFCMRYAPGFEAQILEAVQSEDDDVRHEGVVAAGEREVGAAWPHIVHLVSAKGTGKGLLLASIEAVANLRPQEAEEVLEPLSRSPDPEIREAVEEAMSIALARIGESDAEL